MNEPVAIFAAIAALSWVMFSFCTVTQKLRNHERRINALQDESNIHASEWRRIRDNERRGLSA